MPPYRRKSGAFQGDAARPGARSITRLTGVTDPAREIVLWRVANQARRYPDLEIAPLDTSALSPLDAAFAHAVYDAVLRRWMSLGFLIELNLRDPWLELEPRMKSALLVGAAQILFLDRVPSYAAVDASVAWAREAIRPGAAGMVNAVLRRVSELLVPLGAEQSPRREQWTDRRDELPSADGGAIALMSDVLPEDPLRRLSVATSHPLELLRSWSRSMPARDVRRVALHGVAHAPTILNTAHLDPGAPALNEANLSAHTVPGHHVWKGSREDLEALFRSRGDVWVQDPASSRAIAAIADLRPEVVIDACAGQGTKTLQLARCFPDATIVATDLDEIRRATLVSRFKGSERVQVVAHKRLADWAGRADLVVLDVPCSNTGVLARRVEARYRFDEKRLQELAGMQRQIIADSVRLLKPAAPGQARGRVLFATCSLDERENERQAEWADRWHALTPSRADRLLPQGGPGEPPEKWTDGSFSVLLG